MDVIKLIINYINNNQLEQALEIILENEDYLSNNSEFWNTKGILSIKIKEYRTAIECLKKSINIDPENENSYYNLGYACEKLGIYTDSAIYYGLAEKYTNDYSLKGELKNIYFDNENLFKIKKCAKNSKKKTFIILSSCGFGEVLQRMHHISKSLVKFGHNVIYISPTVNINITSKNISIDLVVNDIINNRRSVEGVQVYEPLDVYFENKYLYSTYLNLVQRFVDTSENEVIIVPYMPYQVEVIKSLKGRFKVIYECVDDHTDFKNAFWGNKKDILWEQELMNISDGITTTATSLYLQRVSIEKRENVYISRNAVNEIDFIIKNDIPDDLENIPEPRIIYSGAIYDWFDKELFYEVVKSNPDKSFVIIGFGNEDILNEKLDNLYILGVKKHSELKNYLLHSQVGIIPFKDDLDLIINCDAIKQYEYLACGLPVVTTYMPESLINKIYTYNASNKDDFNKCINDALSIEVDKNIISQFIVENSWNERATLLCSIAEGKIDHNETQRTLEIINYKLSEMNINNKPQYLILYAMLFNNIDKHEFLIKAEEAYSVSDMEFIERWYIYALYINGKIKSAISVALNSKYVKKRYKTELLYNVENDIDQRITLNYYIKNYFDLYNLISQNEQITVSNLANYYYEIGAYEEAISLYEKYFKINTSIKSPLTLYNYSELLKISNDFYSYKNLRNMYIFNEEKYLRKQIEISNKSKDYITLLIPTRNRPELLERCITYFENFNDESFQIKIFILDASDEEERVKIRNMLTKHDESTVKFFEFGQDSDAYQRTEAVLDIIDSEYCCLCADDDFLDKDGIIKSIEILKNDKEVITVKGDSYIFLNNDLEKIYFFKKDSCESLVDDNPIERLKGLVDNWVPQFLWLVYRKESLELIISNIQNYDKQLTILFKEYLWYFLVPLNGKVVNISKPLNIRDENPKSGSYVFPGFFNCIKDGTFNELYKYFRRAIIEFSSLNKNINEQINTNCDEIMASFLVNSWHIPRKYVVYNNGIFNLELLRIGIEAIK